MGNFNLGLCSVSFRENTPEEIVKAAKEAGLTCIEWGSDIHAPYSNEDALDNIVNLQNEYGISCSSYGTYFYIMRDSSNELIEYIKAAKKLGTNVLRLWCGEKGSAKYLDSEKEELYTECRKLAEIAKNEGRLYLTYNLLLSKSISNTVISETLILLLIVSIPLSIPI